MILSEEIKTQIREYCIKNIPKESCGLIVDIRGILTIYPCKNISYHSNEHAILNPLDYVRAAKLGKIVCHWHSHEHKGTSLIDNLNAFNHNVYSVIYSWKYDRFYVIEPKLEEYLNLDYKFGKNDCFELVRNYYKNELNILISNYDRYEKWELDKPTYILDNFEKEGFYKIKLNDIKLHDVFIFKIYNSPSHLGVYLENNFILHHPINEKSVISEITDGLKKRINCIVRHKDIKNE